MPNNRHHNNITTMSQHHTRLLTIIISILSLSLLPFLSASATPRPSHSNSSTLTAYEILELYDLPIGLLPTGVQSYDLNTTTGAFKLYLNTTCTFAIDSYELKYKPAVTGVIATDKLSSLTGIYVKVYWFWLSITAVTRDDDELVFSVGVASAAFDVSGFDECPECGCGFDCGGRRSTGGEGKRGKMRLKRFDVYSSSS